jgi:hypothetical protein
MGVIDKYQNPSKAKMAVFRSEMPKNRKTILSDAEYKQLIHLLESPKK